MADIRSYPSWLHGELRNWAKWTWEGTYPHPMPPRVCGSVEGDYVTPVYDGAQVETKPIPADAERAKIVDSIWRNLPTDQRMVLRAEYPARSDYEWAFGRAGVARQLKMRLKDYEDALFAAATKVWKAFEVSYR